MLWTPSEELKKIAEGSQLGERIEEELMQVIRKEKEREKVRVAQSVTRIRTGHRVKEETLRGSFRGRGEERQRRQKSRDIHQCKDKTGSSHNRVNVM